MSTTLIGTVAYGGLPFLKILLNGIRETLTEKADILVVVAKPNDTEMCDFLISQNIRFVQNKINCGFAASVNDLYDEAFVRGGYDNLIICGNDIVPMPGALDALIRCADSTTWEMICGSEFNAKFLVSQYHEARKFFHGENLVFTDFSARPWELHQDFRNGVEPDTRKDIRNFTLFKRSSFEKAGYDDVNYWPNSYFADNTYGRKCDLLGVSAAGLLEASFFHFTSRTIHQSENRDHGKFFRRNSGHYVHTWGGPVGGERYSVPYDGRGFQLSPEIFLPGEMKIADRNQEDAIIQYWSNL